jgi:hypothetical protein
MPIELRNGMVIWTLETYVGEQEVSFNNGPYLDQDVANCANRFADNGANPSDIRDDIDVLANMLPQNIAGDIKRIKTQI